MKTSRKILAMIAGLSALASFSYGDQLTLSQDTTNYSVGNGGAFIVTNTTGPITINDYSSLARGDGGFLTFCIEDNEYFTPGNVFNYSLSYGAINGGVSGQDAPNYDGVSKGTAWLYSQFAQGLLSVGSFSYSKANLGDLQQAIWFLEGEGGTNNYLSQYVIANVASWNADDNGSLGVQAINLYNLDGSNAQDQLYYRNPVPDQGVTFVLLGLGLLGLAGIHRKFASAK